MFEQDQPQSSTTTTSQNDSVDSLTRSNDGDHNSRVSQPRVRIHKLVKDFLDRVLSETSSIDPDDEDAEEEEPSFINMDEDQETDSLPSSMESQEVFNLNEQPSRSPDTKPSSPSLSLNNYSTTNLDLNIESDPYGFSSAYFCFGSNEENFLSLNSSQLSQYETGVDGFDGEVISRVTQRTFHTTPMIISTTDNNEEVVMVADSETALQPRVLGGEEVVEHIRMAAYNLGILTRRMKSFHDLSNKSHPSLDEKENGTICYISGSNERGQFGLPEKFKRTSSFRKVDYFEKNGIQIKDMTFGSYFTLFLSANGQLFSAGDNENGQLGRSSLDNQFNIEQVKIVNPETSEEEFITQIEAGAFHCAFLAKSGNVYSQGYNCWGQSGHEGDDIIRPTRIDIFGKEKIEIERIVCIEHNTFFITKPNPFRDIYGCGFSKKGQLGGEHGGESVRQPVKLHFFSGKDKSVKSISGGWGHVIIVTQDGSVYAQGLNDYGQCGVGDLETRKETTLIPFFTETLYKQSYLEKIEEVQCGSYHSLFLSRSGKLFGCGYNEMGSLSLGSESWITIPTLIVEFPSYLIGEPHYQLELKTWCYTTAILVKKRSKRVEQFFTNLMRSLQHEARFFDLLIV